MMTLSKWPSERLEHKQLKSPNWRTNIYLLWSDRIACRKVHRLTQPIRPVKGVERMNGRHIDE